MKKLGAALHVFAGLEIKLGDGVAGVEELAGGGLGAADGFGLGGVGAVAALAGGGFVDGEGEGVALGGLVGLVGLVDGDSGLAALGGEFLLGFEGFGGGGAFVFGVFFARFGEGFGAVGDGVAVAFDLGDEVELEFGGVGAFAAGFLEALFGEGGIFVGGGDFAFVAEVGAGELAAGIGDALGVFLLFFFEFGDLDLGGEALAGGESGAGGGVGGAFHGCFTKGGGGGLGADGGEKPRAGGEEAAGEGLGGGVFLGGVAGDLLLEFGDLAHGGHAAEGGLLDDAGGIVGRIEGGLPFLGVAAGEDGGDLFGDFFDGEAEGEDAGFEGVFHPQLFVDLLAGGGRDRLRLDEGAGEGGGVGADFETDFGGGGHVSEGRRLRCRRLSQRPEGGAQRTRRGGRRR